MAVVLYNTATFDANNPEKDEGKLGIVEFVNYYNQMYYFQTSRWVESKIEEYLTKSELNKEELLQIFAWKTNRIKMQKSQYEKEFFFSGKENDKKDNEKWVINDENETATSSTRQKIKPSELYAFLSVVEEQKKVYHKALNNEKKEKDLSELKEDILKTLTDKKVLPKGIGSVYLITFFYFITQGDEPIYDYFAMKALDAIYPDGGQQNSFYLGCPVDNRADPPKSANLLECSVYNTYRKKLDNFVDEYNKNSKEKVSRNNRIIDRALWVYGHFFQ